MAREQAAAVRAAAGAANAAPKPSVPPEFTAAPVLMAPACHAAALALQAGPAVAPAPACAAAGPLCGWLIDVRGASADTGAAMAGACAASAEVTPAGVASQGRVSIPWLSRGYHRFRVRAVDAAGNKEVLFREGENQHTWYYVPPIPWMLILGIIFGFVAFVMAVFLELRRRRRKAAMYRYAIKRMRRKFKHAQGRKRGEAAEWKKMAKTKGDKGKHKKKKLKSGEEHHKHRRRHKRSSEGGGRSKRGGKEARGGGSGGGTQAGGPRASHQHSSTRKHKHK